MRPGGFGAAVTVVLGVLLLLSGEVVAKNWQDDCVFKPNAVNPTSAECEFKSREVRI